MMRMLGVGCVAACVAWGLGLAAPAAGQEFCAEGWQAALGPALIADDDGDVTGGLKGALDLCRAHHAFEEDFPSSTWLRGHAGGEVPFSSLRIPYEVTATIAGGWSVSLSRVSDSDDIEADFYDFHHGFAAAGARVGVEADARFRERAVTGGAELRYVDPLRPWLPSVVAMFDWVRPLSSNVRDELGLALSTHERLTLRGYWLVPLGSSFELELDGELFRAWGLADALESLGWDDGERVAGALAWLPNTPIASITLEAVFVEYASGRPATAPADWKAWTVGVRLGGRSTPG